MFFFLFSRTPCYFTVSEVGTSAIPGSGGGKATARQWRPISTVGGSSSKSDSRSPFRLSRPIQDIHAPQRSARGRGGSLDVADERMSRGAAPFRAWPIGQSALSRRIPDYSV